jgi:hypothetical protein
MTGKRSHDLDLLLTEDWLCGFQASITLTFNIFKLWKATTSNILQPWQAAIFNIFHLWQAPTFNIFKSWLAATSHGFQPWHDPTFNIFKHI